MGVGTLVVGVFAIGGAWSAIAGQRSTPPSGHRLIDVPYFPQTPALCGGAALAMVLRYWGDRTVLPSDFQPLVRPSAGGIVTADLVAAVARLGWRAFPSQAQGPTVTGDLGPDVDQGRPVIALIERSPSEFHYVVIVGLTETSVVLHDPARTSFEVVAADAFNEQWRGSGRWFLIVLPPEASGSLSTRADAPTPAIPHARAGACGALIDRGVALADTSPEAAERALKAASELCPRSADPWLELAGLSFKAGHWRDAASLAERATALEPENQDAWEIVGSARYLSNDETGALDAWNHLGEPPIDVVTISGARRTPQPALMHLIGLEPRTVLSREAFERATRRLADAPTAASTRLTYEPESDARVAVSAAIAERESVPHQIVPLAVLVAHAIVAEELQVDLAGLAGQGELITGDWRWPSARPLVGGSIVLPAPAPLPGIASIGGFWEQQSYAVPAPSGGTTVVRDERRRVTFDVGTWVSGSTRLEAGAGVDRFGAADYLSLRVAIEEHWAGDRLAARAEGNAWRVGPGTGFSTRDVSLMWRSNPDPSVAAWSGLGGLADATANAPRALWMGAGTGQGRPLLLRAHPLLTDDIVASPMFGRRVVFHTIEYHHPLKRTLAGTIGMATFVDAARASGGVDAAAPPAWNVDAGVGLRLHLFQRGGVARFDVARGLRDGRMALSVGWSSTGGTAGTGGAAGSVFGRNGSW
jgi:hypothetical protein